jgi:hypothetical protein
MSGLVAGVLAEPSDVEPGWLALSGRAAALGQLDPRVRDRLFVLRPPGDRAAQRLQLRLGSNQLG